MAHWQDVLLYFLCSAFWNWPHWCYLKLNRKTCRTVTHWITGGCVLQDFPPFKLKPDEGTGKYTQEGYNVVSVSGPLWYSTLRWKTSQTVVAHHYSNYQQQECPFIPITSFFLSSYCTLLLIWLCSYLCFWLLHLYSPSTLSFSSSVSTIILPPLRNLSLDCTALNVWHSCYRITYLVIWPGSICLNGRILDYEETNML